ncbi:SDR family NAD(P)-dependent oxidoreductase [Spirosoma areae]
MNKVLVILGAGAGISQSVAKAFGRQGFSIALVSRNAEKLNSFTEELTNENIVSQAFTGDVSDEAAMQKTVADIKAALGRIDVVHYNAAAMRMVNVLDETAETLIADFKVNVAGLQTIALVTQTELEANAGAILTTGGGFAMYPSADFASLSIGKAGLRNLSESLSQALGKKGIFVGTLTIKGYVTPESEVHNPDNIARHFWKLYADRTAFEIQL